MRVAIAADDAKFRGQLERLLAGQSHGVSSLPWADGILKALKESRPDLLVLAPSSGRERVGLLLRELRADADLRRLPVLCVNPKGTTAEGVACLDAGADDFINRPFNAQIFLARVRTFLRRRVWSGEAREDDVTRIASGSLEMRLVLREARVSGRALPLTRLEFDLLAYLAGNPEQVFKREDLLEAVWHYPDNVETRTLDKHVETLRRKLGDLGSIIQTVHGVGYRFKDSGSPSPAREGQP